jgi:hypothetical protein
MKTRVAALACALVLCACAIVPPETVKLSSAVGSEMAEIKKSHIAQINISFSAIEQQTSRAVDTIYAPDIVKVTLLGPSGKLLLEKLEAAKLGGAAAEDALAFANRYLIVVHTLIEKERRARLKPIADAKARVLANAEAAWAQATQGNAVVTGYLASAVKVRQAQDDLFKGLGLPGDTQTLGLDVASFSDKVQKAADDLSAKDAKLEDVKKQIDEALAELKTKLNR